MPKKFSPYSFVRLKNSDQALKVILLMLIRDKSYETLPMRQILTFYKSIISNNYLLLTDHQNIMAVLMWMYITPQVRDDCLNNNRAPQVKELCDKGDALYCIAFSGISAKFLLPLWRKFMYEYRDQDILLKRHFKNGVKKENLIILVRNQRKIHQKFNGMR